MGLQLKVKSLYWLLFIKGFSDLNSKQVLASALCTRKHAFKLLTAPNS